MALILSDFETLVNTFGVKENQTLTGLVKQSREIAEHWKDYRIDNSSKPNFDITPDMTLAYETTKGEKKEVDISDYAFSQLCTRLGLPSKYVKKCVDCGKSDLALQNFREWAGDCKSDMLVREHDGVARAVLSGSYTPFDSYKILKALNNTVDTTKYTPAQVYLSTDRLSIRFVNFNPLEAKGIKDDSPIFSGFCVDSSDVGRGSLNMKFFLYRYVCKNGLVVSSMGGRLFRQYHMGEKITENKAALFNQAFKNIDALTEQSIDLIKANEGQMLNSKEIGMYLEKARREMKLSERGANKLEEIFSLYPRNRWGLVNAVTELAQNYTLDTRLEMENFAGELFAKVA